MNSTPESSKFNSDSVYFQEGHLAADHQVVFIAEQLRNTSDDVFHVSALQVGQLNASGLIQNISDTAYLPSSQGYPPEMYAGDEANYYFERPRLTGDNNGQSPLMWSAAALLRPLD